MRTAALQVILRAPPIALELERLNAEFRLFALRKMTRYGDLVVRPDEITYLVDRIEIHSAERASFPYHRMTAQEATWMAGSPGLHVYTDRSYAEELAGAAYAVFGRANRVEAVGRFSVSRATSAFCAEAVALAEALKCLKALPRPRTCSCTDGLSLLQAILSRTNTDSRILKMQQTIVNIALKANVRLYHVPSHRGVFGNEVADFIASRAARRGLSRTNK
ncbi:hypothetical protein MRX96_052371 [Rhipicephalus microplus]